MTSFIEEAEGLVFELWQKQRSLVRQAMFWDAAGKVTVVAFPSAASREGSLGELARAAADLSPVRVAFFSESSATNPRGEKIDVIVLELADARTSLYTQRIYTPAEPPVCVMDDTKPLATSPLATIVTT
ncbi:MAG: hypothetical protein KIT84_00945 [Labilithrix sp.]|nr:hypothetical protein [Labilithrix sp.]MCW5809551.1 hypothetical protein [Labilithrix sp.]